MTKKIPLSALETDIMRYLDRVGWASTQSIQIAVRRNRFSINAALNTLYKMRRIERRMHGMAFSHKYLSTHPEQRQAIESYFGFTFTL